MYISLIYFGPVHIVCVTDVQSFFIHCFCALTPLSGIRTFELPLRFQGMTNIVTIFLCVLLHTIQPYPDGAPSCVSKPAHGSSKQAVSLQVVKIAQRKWKVGGEERRGVESS